MKHLVEHVKLTLVARRNACGGRSAGEHLIAALRCIYLHAEQDGLVTPGDNPASKVAKPRRLASTRRAVPTLCSPMSTTSRPLPEMTRPWTPSCSACISRRRAVGAARWRCDPSTLDPTQCDPSAREGPDSPLAASVPDPDGHLRSHAAERGS